MPIAPSQWSPTKAELSGKTILVTGASEGIGRAASVAYAGCGAEVLLLSRSEERLEALYDEIVALGAPKPALLPMDLAKATHDDFVTLAGSLSEALPKLDGLLHNASLLGDRKPIAQTPSCHLARRDAGKRQRRLHAYADLAAPTRSGNISIHCFHQLRCR